MVVLVFLVARKAAKVGLKVEAPAFALVRPGGRVVCVWVLADTAWTPSVEVEAFPSGQVPQSELLWPPRDKLELRAFTRGASRFDF